MVEASYCVAGKILRVDLTTKRHRVYSTIDYTEKFLGGRGLNWWLLYEGTQPWVTPYDPDNLLVYGTGLLVGTLAPCAARFSIDSKNPFNSGIGSANSGGHFASELKYAGYDHIVFQGRAKKPVYLCLDDNRVEIKDASHIWGKTTWETDDIIKEELGDRDFQVSCIGPAGENLVRSACIITNRARAAGRCGLGAVMGSKNVKALAVRGTGSIEVKKPKQFMETIDNAWGKIKQSRKYEQFSVYGTLGNFPISTLEKGKLNIVVKNFQDGYMESERAERIKGHLYHNKYEERSLACFVCPYQCSNFYRVNEGPYAPLAFEKMERNAIVNFGTNLYIDDATAIMKAQALCTEYGLDIDCSSTAIAWAFECYQRRILGKKDTDGLELIWGNHEVVMGLLRKIAYREGFGNILAEGVKRASEIIGRGSEKYAVYIKDEDNRERMRTAKGWALGVALALRGGGHTTGASHIELLGLDPGICEEVWGVAGASEPSVYKGKPELVVYFERLHAVLDSLGICIFAGNWEGPDLPGPDDFANMVSAAMGWEITGKDLMLIGERIHNVGKAFNTLHAGFSRRHDYPPERLMKEPIKSGPTKGDYLDRDEWDKMLNKYYELHGWDKKTGWQTKECLHSLHLKEIVKDLFPRAPGNQFRKQ